MELQEPLNHHLSRPPPRAYILDKLFWTLNLVVQLDIMEILGQLVRVIEGAYEVACFLARFSVTIEGLFLIQNRIIT